MRTTEIRNASISVHIKSEDLDVLLVRSSNVLAQSFLGSVFDPEINCLEGSFQPSSSLLQKNHAVGNSTFLLRPRRILSCVM
jgi:hypothetical protein